jgi:sRNA-binding carbon storage regulator CsrA
MLALMRNEGENVVIDVPPSSEPTQIIVSLVRIHTATQARLAFMAPKAVQIDREEIAIAKRREREQLSRVPNQEFECLGCGQQASRYVAPAHLRDAKDHLRFCSVACCNRYHAATKREEQQGQGK